MKRVAMFFSESQRQRLRALSQKTGLSVSEIVRRAVDEFLERMK
jgi:predicted DNA-binding protein